MDDKLPPDLLGLEEALRAPQADLPIDLREKTLNRVTRAIALKRLNAPKRQSLWSGLNFFDTSLPRQRRVRTLAAIAAGVLVWLNLTLFAAHFTTWDYHKSVDRSELATRNDCLRDLLGAMPAAPAFEMQTKHIPLQSETLVSWRQIQNLLKE